ncbi:MAG: hypothetical protein Q9227_006378 [Pyrenula ochraceoflavens]
MASFWQQFMYQVRRILSAPHVLTFNTATLLAAACCIPAILSLISMWMKILELNWKTRFGSRSEDESNDDPIEGTNGATIRKMRKVNEKIRFFLSALGVPILSGAILAILIIGERNFFSSQVRYQTEPMASIGQWAPILGTGLAAMGSLYLLLAADVAKEENPKLYPQHCNCSHHHHESSDQSSVHSRAYDDHMQGITGPITMSSPITSLAAADEKRGSSDDVPETRHEIAPTATRSPQQDNTVDLGSRRKVAKGITKVANFFGTAAYDQFDDSEFKHGKASDFPEIPGEENRNRDLHQIRETYNRQHTERSVSPMPRSRSGSFNGSVRSVSRDPSPVPSIRMPQSRQHSSSLPKRASSEPQASSPVAPVDTRVGRQHKRRDTLEVPSPVRHSHSRHDTLTSSNAFSNNEVPSSPTIVISSEPDTYSSQPVTPNAPQSGPVATESTNT